MCLILMFFLGNVGLTLTIHNSGLGFLPVSVFSVILKKAALTGCLQYYHFAFSA